VPPLRLTGKRPYPNWQTGRGASWKLQYHFSITRFLPSRLPEHEQEQDGREVQILLHADATNLLFVGSPDCVLPDASGKFFAHF
jgi:hypothetical protein